MGEITGVSVQGTWGQGLLPAACTQLSQHTLTFPLWNEIQGASDEGVVCGVLCRNECSIKKKIDFFFHFLSSDPLNKGTLIPLRTIKRNLVKFRLGLGAEQKLGSGLKPNLDTTDYRQISQLAKHHSKISAKKVACLVPNKETQLIRLI